MRYFKKKKFYKEKGYFGDYGRVFKVKREEWEYVCGVIFLKDVFLKVFAVDFNVRRLDLEMFIFFSFW